jgi:hypothetical protein
MQGICKRLITKVAIVALLSAAVVAWAAPTASAGAFSNPTSIGVGPSPQSVAVGDFNGDADPDLAVVNQLSNNVSVLLGAAGGSFTGPTNFAVCSGPTAIAAGDFHGDSDRDLVTANELCNTVSVLLGAAGGSFTAAAGFATGSLPDAVAVGQLTADLDPDVVVANQGSDSVSVLFGGAGAGFIGPVDFPAGDGPTSVAIADFNGDASQDLAITNEATSVVSILLATNAGGYARPKGATPFRSSLVLAYNACAAGGANRTHGGPLSHPSCGPPVQSSAFVTAGTPDANSNSAQFIGSVLFRAGVSDVNFDASLRDVRNKAGLTDYLGELQARFTVRRSDRSNGPSLTEAATVQDLPLSFTLSCAPTAGPASIGSTCGVSTSANAVIPGQVQAEKRAVWEMSQIQVLDGGPDGDVDTATGNTVFARQGVFAP